MVAHGRWFVAAAALMVVLSGIAVALRPGIVGKVRRRLFPPTIGAVHVFGSGVPAVQPGTGPVQGPINTSFPGLTTFRGNASRDYYGEGPVPSEPQIDWTYPSTGKLCMQSIDNGITFQGAVQLWCGTGWTGQPNVVQQPDGSTEVRIGAYDGAYHFLNGQTGQPVGPDRRPVTSRRVPRRPTRTGIPCITAARATTSSASSRRISTGRPCCGIWTR